MNVIAYNIRILSGADQEPYCPCAGAFQAKGHHSRSRSAVYTAAFGNAEIHQSRGERERRNDLPLYDQAISDRVAVNIQAGCQARTDTGNACKDRKADDPESQAAEN